jgi:catechol 2,3-dioxygenase-like lactoylglutathione lyase family enzyme
MTSARGAAAPRVFVTVHSIHHANIRARAGDIARLKHFYCEVLGLQQGYRPPFASNGYWLYAAGQPVLHLVEAAETSAGVGAVDHISFCCGELDSVKVRLKERGIPYQITQVPVLGHLQLFFRDPLGLGVELTVLG